MLKLYFLPGTCALVPHVALEWSHLDYQAIEISREDIKSAEYLAMNPQGQVPLLVDGDWNLSQNLAILDYINDLVPEQGIFGRDAIKDARVRARARQWIAYANSDLHPCFLTIFKANKMIDGDEAQKILIQKAVANVIKMFAAINRRLAQHHYVAGDNISIADVYIYVVLRWAEICKIDLSQYEHLPAFYQRIEADTGVQAALKTQNLL